MSREKEFVKNSAILSIGTIFPKITSIITLPIITGCLTKADYGIYDLITVSVLLVLPVATLQMQAAAFRSRCSAPAWSRNCRPVSDPRDGHEI